MQKPNPRPSKKVSDGAVLWKMMYIKACSKGWQPNQYQSAFIAATQIESMIATGVWKSFVMDNGFMQATFGNGPVREAVMPEDKVTVENNPELPHNQLYVNVHIEKRSGGTGDVVDYPVHEICNYKYHQIMVLFSKDPIQYLQTQFAYL